MNNALSSVIIKKGEIFNMKEKIKLSTDAKMRLIQGVLEYLQELDKDTAVTKHAIYKAVRSGALPSRRLGARYLIDADLALRYFAGEDIQIGERRQEA
jgi:hypothetical protein